MTAGDDVSPPAMARNLIIKAVDIYINFGISKMNSFLK
jgi:hypothetical protein